MSAKKIRQKPKWADDPDGTYFMEIDMPSGNQARAVITYKDGSIRTELTFVRPPSENELKGLPEMMQHSFVSMFGHRAFPAFVVSNRSEITAQVNAAVFPEAKN